MVAATNHRCLTCRWHAHNFMVPSWYFLGYCSIFSFTPYKDLCCGWVLRIVVTLKTYLTNVTAYFRNLTAFVFREYFFRMGESLRAFLLRIAACKSYLKPLPPGIYWKNRRKSCAVQWFGGLQTVPACCRLLPMRNHSWLWRRRKPVKWGLPLSEVFVVCN